MGKRRTRKGNAPTESGVLPPPAHLSEVSRTLWREAMATMRGWTAPRIQLLIQTLNSLDRAEEARTAVAEQGMCTVTESTGAVHINPLLKAEREFRQQFLTGLDRLGLLALGGPLLKG